MKRLRSLCCQRVIAGAGDGEAIYTADISREAIANAIEAACGVRLTALGTTSERIYDALHASPQNAHASSSPKALAPRRQGEARVERE